MYSTVEKAELNAKSKETADDIRDGARRIKDDIRDAAGNVKHDLEDIARQAGSTAREFVSDAEERVTSVTEAMTSKIYDNPVQSSVIALAVGVFLGLVFSSRR